MDDPENKAARFEQLMDLYQQHKATADEIDELESLMSQEYFQQRFNARFDQVFYDEQPLHDMSKEDAAEMMRNIVGSNPTIGRSLPVWRWVAAAAVLLIASVLGFYSLNRNNETEVAVVNAPTPAEPIDKPILRLGDGSQIELTEKGNTIPPQGSANVKNQQGQLSYNNPTLSGGEGKGEAKEVEVVYNEVATPKGMQYHLTLADGSEVWLNAASSIRYPVVFSGDKREVQLTGEAYFEIAHNEQMPFHVTTANGMDVRVLGTHFNVMAYEDEASINTTLLEGSVRVSTALSDAITLVPNQQAQVSKGNAISLVKDADVTQAMAWRNNRFIFHDADIKEVMRHLARWYDLEVIYEGEVTQTVTSTIPRDVPVGDLLETLEFISNVKFEVQGKKVTVIAN